MHFKPPVIPSMGGDWESLVRSVKRALKVLVHERLFTEESLYRFLCKIESLLNCRPLIHTSDDANDQSVLTLIHILLCQDLNSYNPDKFIDGEINLRKKTRAAQAAANMF